MFRTNYILAGMLLAGSIALAQDSENLLQKLKLQIHGNAAQGFLFSSGNNYLTTKSSDGSAKWTEGSLSVGRSINDKFRVGAQAHSYSLGELGRQNVMLDWAYGDYKFNSYFGIRVGKVKTPFGLYNEVQDVDAVHPWALLPQAVYPADMRSFSLAHVGGVIYGSFSPLKHLGTIEYSAYGGQRSQPGNEGFSLSMAAQGISRANGSGPMAGADVKWRTPLEGLLLGASYSHVDLSAPSARAGVFPLPIQNVFKPRELYAQFEKGKITLSGEWYVNPIFTTFGQAPRSYAPMRSWYTMVSYRASSKFTIGSYYDQTWFFLYNRDRSDPSNHLKDVAVSGRYEINRYFYAKLEGHYMDGNADGFYRDVNPNGFQKITRLALCRFGFAF